MSCACGRALANRSRCAAYPCTFGGGGGGARNGWGGGGKFSLLWMYLAAPPPRDELVPSCCFADFTRVMPFGDLPALNTCPTPPPLPAQPPAAGAAAGAAATSCAGETNRRFGPKGFGECGGVPCPRGAAVAVTLAGDTQEAKWVCCSLLFEARTLGTCARVFST